MISVELILLGIYALLNVGISYSVFFKWEDKRVLVHIKTIFIVLMMPYHFVLKFIKTLIKSGKQEHVAYLFVYYMLSALIVFFSYIVLVGCIARASVNEAFNGVIGFVLVCILIAIFFLCGKLFAYVSTKQLIKGVQKIEIKKQSKVNWRKTLNNKEHRDERKHKFEEEWSIVKRELSYTRIYFYIILTIFILWIPKESGSISELLSNQFMGITTIAALGREAKGQIEKADDIR